jgi:hypothetical protein
MTNGFHGGARRIRLLVFLILAGLLWPEAALAGRRVSRTRVTRKTSRGTRTVTRTRVRSGARFGRAAGKFGRARRRARFGRVAGRFGRVVRRGRVRRGGVVVGGPAVVGVGPELVGVGGPFFGPAFVPGGVVRGRVAVRRFGGFRNFSRRRVVFRRR